MCKIKVTLPKLNKFLLFYSLKTGSTIILLWFLIRCLASLGLALIAIPELFLGGSKAFHKFYLTTNAATPSIHFDTHNFLIYGVMVVFLMIETTNLVHIGYLLNGLICVKSVPIKNFLVSRAFTWFMEVLVVMSLCIVHTILLGWYLILLMVFMIEVYSYVVIYSYYCELYDTEAVASKPTHEWP